MDISLILKVAGAGILVSVVCQILTKSGRDEQALMVTIAGLVVVMVMVVTQIYELFNTIKNLFEL